MKRYTTASVKEIATGNEDRPPGEGASGGPGLSLATPSVWTHTLVLTGELDQGSAKTLEAEVERLCDEGVTGITLDLRKLTYIDSVGVAVIAFLCGLCRRRGYGFAVIPGSRLMYRTFEHAGVADLVPSPDD